MYLAIHHPVNPKHSYHSRLCKNKSDKYLYSQLGKNYCFKDFKKHRDQRNLCIFGDLIVWMPFLKQVIETFRTVGNCQLERQYWSSGLTQDLLNIQCFSKYYVSWHIHLLFNYFNDNNVRPRKIQPKMLIESTQVQPPGFVHEVFTRIQCYSNFRWFSTMMSYKLKSTKDTLISDLLTCELMFTKTKNIHIIFSAQDLYVIKVFAQSLDIYYTDVNLTKRTYTYLFTEWFYAEIFGKKSI